MVSNQHFIILIFETFENTNETENGVTFHGVD